MKTLESQQAKQGAVTLPSRARSPRVAEVDWLRTLIVLAIIPYHAVVIFSAASATVIKNTFSDTTLPIVVGALQAWGIALIFLLAGASGKFALDVRSPATYVKERLLRLLVPMALAMLILAPLRAYYLLLANPDLIRVSLRPITHPEQLQNIGTFFLYYWGSLLTTGSPIVVTNGLAHLWFVPRLLIASLICVPLFLFLRTRWPRWIARIASSRILTAVLLLGAGFVPAAAVAALQPGWLHRLTAGLALNEDWTTFALQFVMFIFGYLLYSSASLRANVRQLAYVLLTLAVICWGIILMIRINGDTPPNNFSLSAMLFTLLQVFAIWLLTIAVIGLAMRYLPMSPPWQQYLTTATFPVFILHLPVLTIAAYYLQALPVPWYVLLVLIIVVTFAVSFALYEYVVRRVPPIRFLFGLKPPQTKRR
jgi:peptidoglycan/LPS O-acetylase OafA/YrhL